MAHTITIEPGFLRAVFFDAFTRSDLTMLTPEIDAIEQQLGRTPDRLVDLRRVTAWEVTYADMLTFVEERKRRRYDALVRTAIVAPQAASMGFARMFQTLNDHPEMEIQIFSTLEQAETWLRSH